VIRRKEVAFQY
jgi:hypothetical protein